MNAEYIYLFNAITEAIEQMEKLKADLLNAQSQAEELYLARTD